jgi:hypothetical protein
MDTLPHELVIRILDFVHDPLDYITVLRASHVFHPIDKRQYKIKRDIYIKDKLPFILGKPVKSRGYTYIPLLDKHNQPLTFSTPFFIGDKFKR